MSILSFRQEFDLPIQDIIRALHNCDTCPHVHHCHAYKFDQDGSVQLVEKMGHPLVCYNEGTACTSKLRILRCASFHYPVLLRFLKSVHKALSLFSVVKQIDTALGIDDYAMLMCFTKTKGCTDLLSDEVETGYVQSQSGSGSIVSKHRQPNLEPQLMNEHAAIIERLEKLTEDFAEHVCVSCERLCQRPVKRTLQTPIR